MVCHKLAVAPVLETCGSLAQPVVQMGDRDSKHKDKRHGEHRGFRGRIDGPKVVANLFADRITAGVAEALEEAYLANKEVLV